MTVAQSWVVEVLQGQGTETIGEVEAEVAVGRTGIAGNIAVIMIVTGEGIDTKNIDQDHGPLLEMTEDVEKGTEGNLLP